MLALVAQDTMHVLAARWWLSGSGDDAYEEVWEIVNQRSEALPELISALVATAPAGESRYVGTAILEELIVAEKAGSGASALEFRFDANLARANLFEVLSGVYCELLSKARLAELGSTHLSPTQIEWLLDPNASGRWSDRGTMIAEGDTFRFVSDDAE